MNPILCDYCDAIATMFFPRRGPADRAFSCEEHIPRAKGALSVIGEKLTGILPNRPRFDELDTTEKIYRRWEAHRAAFVLTRPAARA